MSIYARLAIVIVLVGAVAALWWKADRMLAKADATGYSRRAQEDADRAELQREMNRGAARKAEEQQAAQAEVREKFIVTTIKEVSHATDNLAACVLTPAARLRLDAAAECAGQSGPATCGAEQPVRNP